MQDNRRAEASQRSLVVEEFDKTAREYAKKYVDCSQGAHSFTTRLQRVLELLDDSRGTSVLDVGCGPGLTVDYCVDRGLEFVGVDVSKEMIHECRRKFGDLKGARFFVGDVENLACADESFDIVICMGVVEYLDNAHPAVREMARVLRPGGSLLLTLPNKVSPYRMWSRTYQTLVRTVKSLSGRKVTKNITHRARTEAHCRRLIASHNLMTDDIVFYNFRLVLRPLDQVMPTFTAKSSQRLERFCRSRMRWLGTGFILKAIKV
ncbi:class I SAM-dependent methyltransferase [Thermodesulfobacteriota bacterium]